MTPSRRHTDRARQKRATVLTFTTLGGLGASVTAARGWHAAQQRPWAAVVMIAILVLAQLMPISFLRRKGTVEVATSGGFTMALLLFSGIGPALVGQLLASVLSDVVRRRGGRQTVFNLGRFALAVAASGTVLRLLTRHEPLHDGRLRAGAVGAIVAAAIIFLAVTNGLAWTMAALSTGRRVRRLMADEWLFHIGRGLALAGMAPLIALVAVQALPLLPLSLFPVAALYAVARSSVAQAHQALHDDLTGLANRARFEAAVDKALREPGRARRPLAVLLIDLDRFKEVNDTLGHHTGDVLLRAIGPRLVGCGDAVSLIARLGGDEFAVLLDKIEGPGQAIEVARRLTQALEEPFVLDDGLLLEVEASIGVAIAPNHGGDVDVLLRRADVAMYLAKGSKSGIELYAPERDGNTRRRLAMIGQLRSAIANNELTLHYQPKLNLTTNEFSGVEALVRWSHAELGTVPPDEFIPLAERSGLIKPLAHFVLYNAIAQARQWHRDGLLIRVAVNLSARTFIDYELPAMVARLLHDAGMEPKWLELEITETELMADPERGARVLERLHTMGIRLTIDDFGTGHSSLAYLSSLPVDEIKIDRCFIANMTGSHLSADDIIVRSTIELARNLGLEITAEGVETAEQLQQLTALGCHFLQGYYLSRPVPANEIFPLHTATSALALRRTSEPTDK